MKSFRATISQSAPRLQVGCSHPRSRARRATLFVCHSAASSSYVSPSSRTGATELQGLERCSEIVPDVILSQRISDREPAKAATASRAVLAGLMASPATSGPYKFAIEQARYYKDASSNQADLTAARVDRALANSSNLMKDRVTGRVSVEVDPRLAYNTDALIARGRQIATLCADAGVPKERTVLRMPATWQGIRASAALEAEGLATHLICAFSFVQAAAAAQAGASVVQFNVGRLADWYDRNPGVIRDPHGPREGRAMAMAGYGAGLPNPGILLVQKAWAYCQVHHSKTKVMASGLRTKDEALSLAGCDFLVVGPRVLEALGTSTTLEGYNDGLHASGEDNGGVSVRLTPEFAANYDFEPAEQVKVDEATFNDQLGMAATELLESDVARLVADADRLEPIFLNQAGGQE